MDRLAHARWEGDLRTGQGHLSLGSKAFEGKYSFGTRFEGAPGTNPEELIGAAHAGCFSMALAAALTKGGKPPRRIETTATVHLGRSGEGFAITGIDLVTEGEVPGISEAEFQGLAADAKADCIVSRALAAVPITLRATLRG